MTASMAEVYSQHRDTDGFLYMTYASQDMFGWENLPFVPSEGLLKSLWPPSLTGQALLHPLFTYHCCCWRLPSCLRHQTTSPEHVASSDLKISFAFFLFYFIHVRFMVRYKKNKTSDMYPVRRSHCVTTLIWDTQLFGPDDYTATLEQYTEVLEASDSTVTGSERGRWVKTAWDFSSLLSFCVFSHGNPDGTDMPGKFCTQTLGKLFTVNLWYMYLNCYWEHYK